MARTLLRLVLLCSFLPGLAFGNYTDVSVLPDKSATLFVEPLLTSINSGDTKHLQSFVRNHFGSELLNSAALHKHAEHLLSIHQIQGELSFHSSRDYDGFVLPENEIHLVLKTAKTDLWYGVIIVANEKPPHKINRLRFIPARQPSNVPKPPAISIEDAVKELGSYAALLSKMELFSGTVLLAKRDNVLYKSAFGEASKRFNVANNVQTKFNIGSLDKMFTSIAIMQLVDAGKVSLTDKLSKFIDDSWLGAGISDKIEIRHLLTHSSGLGSNFLRAINAWPKNRFRELQDYKVVTKEETQYFEPGTKRRYSNTGMFMLGVVIESVTGQDYFSYIQDNIYDRAGMTNSGAFEMNLPVANLAIGYHRDSNTLIGWRNNLFSHVVKGGPAGGSFSTVDDLHLFALALTSNRLMSKTSTDSALSAKPQLHSPNYGFGFGVKTTPTDRIVGHEGGTTGINSNLDIYLQQGYVSVVMSNYTDGAVYLMRKMREILERVE